MEFVKLSYDIIGAHKSGEHRPAREVINELGLKVVSAESFPMGDMIFFTVKPFDAELPSFISINCC